MRMPVRRAGHGEPASLCVPQLTGNPGISRRLARFTLAVKIIVVDMEIASDRGVASMHGCMLAVTPTPLVIPSFLSRYLISSHMHTGLYR